MRADNITILIDQDQSDDPIFIVEVQTPLGSLHVMAKVIPMERALELHGMHIGGDPARKWGARALLEIVQAVMEKLNVDEIIVVGGVRTTGANPGREPRPRRFVRTSQT